MLRKALVAVAVTGLIALGACSLKKRAPGTCVNRDDCTVPGQTCRLEPPYQYRCVTEDGGVPGCSDDTNPCADGGACHPTTKTCVQCVKNEQCGDKGVCKSATNTCVECVETADCSGDEGACDPGTNTCVECVKEGDCKGDKGVCEISAQTCVQCLVNAHCTTATTPICDSKMCRACKTDSECVETGVCMEDGHCAGATEVVYVEFNAATCPNTTADGTSAKPYCAPNDAVAVLLGAKRVLIIRGPMDGKLALATTAALPIVIGRKNSAGDDASVPAGAGAAISASEGESLIRDLKVVGGTGNMSRGIVASGAGTKLRLFGVTVSLGTGLGIQADTGAELHMDRCLVKDNSVGGMLINGARYNIQNTIVAGNGATTGYGVQINAAISPSRFWFNTVANNPVAATCNLNSGDNLTASIIIGPITNCQAPNSVTTTTFLNSTFHLTAAVPCPDGAPSNPPAYDFDGDPRPAAGDCGADQHTP